MARTELLTVGHGTLPADELVALLAGAGVALLVDVRSYPGSRRHPQFGRDRLERSLWVAGIDYRWERRLGGRRKVQPGSPPVALLLADAAVLTRDAGGTEVYDVGGDAPLPM